jgi:hypothetical protein
VTTLGPLLGYGDEPKISSTVAIFERKVFLLRVHYTQATHTDELVLI